MRAWKQASSLGPQAHLDGQVLSLGSIPALAAGPHPSRWPCGPSMGKRSRVPEVVARLERLIMSLADEIEDANLPAEQNQGASLDARIRRVRRLVPLLDAVGRYRQTAVPYPHLADAYPPLEDAASLAAEGTFKEDGREGSSSRRKRSSKPIAIKALQGGSVDKWFEEARDRIFDLHPKKSRGCTREKVLTKLKRIGKSSTELVLEDLAARVLSHPKWQAPDNDGEFLPGIMPYLNKQLWLEEWREMLQLPSERRKSLVKTFRALTCTGCLEKWSEVDLEPHMLDQAEMYHNCGKEGREMVWSEIRKEQQ